MQTNSLEQVAVHAKTTRLEEGSLILSGPSVALGLPAAPKRFLYHGWQSWSLTAWIDTTRKVQPMRPSILHPMQADPVYVHDHCPNGSWYGAVELENGQIVFLGALGLEAHVALEDNTLKGWYETGDGEWFAGSGDETTIFSQYTRLLKKCFGTGRARQSYRVWCSWYSLYTEIYEAQLLKILNDLGDLPFDVFQIDDGWQKGIGDWEANAKFPSGMDGIAARIKEKRRIPGLWLAPLLIVPSSSIYRDHHDWLLCNERGQLVSAGFNWGERLYALDTTHPEALAWLAALMKKVRGWGYDYAKLDFLYAGALPGKRHNGMSRETAYRHGLKVIREVLGDAYFLTCGTPIFPALGLCDGMRVGPDVAEHWTSHRDDDLLMNFAAPGGRNASRTTLNRLWLQPLVHTDPDVVYFRSRQNGLSPEQNAYLQDLSQIAGFKATSDIPAWLTGNEQIELQRYLTDKPEIQRLGRYSCRIGKRTVDFEAVIRMPPLPSLFLNAWGAVLGSLANIPWLMRIADKPNQASIKQRIERNPV